MSLALSLADLPHQPYWPNHPRRRTRTSPAVDRTPTSPAAGTPTLPSLVALRQAFRPSPTGGDSRCSRSCCDTRDRLFEDEEDDISVTPSYRARPSSSPAPSRYWSTLLATSPSSSSFSTTYDISSLSHSVDSASSSLVLTPPDELPSFAFKQASRGRTSTTRNVSDGPGQRQSTDRLVRELEGGFEWALERALGSLKEGIVLGLPLRRKSRSNQSAALLASQRNGRVAPPSTINQRGRSRSITRTLVRIGECPLTAPRPLSPVRAAVLPPPVVKASTRVKASSSTNPRRSLSLFFLPSRSATTPSAACTAPASSNSDPSEAYLSSLPLLPMTRPPTPSQVLRPLFPVQRPRALERYVVFGHMQRAGKIGPVGGEGEWRRVRERQERREERRVGSGLRYEVSA